MEKSLEKKLRRVCILLNGPIMYDTRVIKIINTLKANFFIDLFYINGNDNDLNLFPETSGELRLFSFKQPKNKLTKIIKHSFFYFEFNFFEKEVKKLGVKYEYIWANDLPTLYPAIKIKRTFGSRVIYDSHEIYLETLNQFFPSNSKGLKKIVSNFSYELMRSLGYWAERSLIKEVDFFVTVSESVKEHFLEKYNHPNITVLMNCPALGTDYSEPIDLKTLIGIEKNTFLLIYQGVISKGRALTKIISAMVNVNKDIHFLLIGDGMIKPELMELVSQLGISNKVSFIDKVPSNVLPKYTKGADAGIILQETDYNLSKKLGIANKFFEYIHAGLPFIATKAPENIKVASDFEVCILVENNIRDISNAINTIATIDLSSFKFNAIKASKVFNWQNQEKKILELIQ